jgi:hypothetical protein
VVSRRVLMTLIALVLLAGLAAAVYLAQTSCPPPTWAFWRFTEGNQPGRVNFACLVRQW